MSVRPYLQKYKIWKYSLERGNRTQVSSSVILWEQLFLTNWNSSKGMDPYSTGFFQAVLFSLGCWVKLWEWIVRKYVEAVREGRKRCFWTYSVIHGDRSISLADTHTCHYCLCGYSGQEWQWKCRGGKKNLLKDRATDWGTVRVIASKGENATKTD